MYNSQITILAHKIQITGIKVSQGDIMVDQKLVLKIWENYIPGLYDQPIKESWRWGIRKLQEFMLYLGKYLISGRWCQTNGSTEQHKWNWRMAQVFQWSYIHWPLASQIVSSGIYNCDQKVWCILLPSAVQRKGRDLQYGKWHIKP